MLQHLTNDIVDFGWGNGLVSSGNKALPEEVLTKSYDALWHNELIADIMQLIFCYAFLKRTFFQFNPIFTAAYFLLTMSSNCFT